MTRRKNPDFLLRAARPTDIDALVALENRSFTSDRLSRRSLRHLIVSPSALFLVGTHGDRVAGALVLLFRAGTQNARLYSLAVAAEYRGQGLATRLLAQGEKLAAARGARFIRLEVRPSNRAAKRLYRGHGFHHFETTANYYEDGAAADRLAKPLARVMS